jgi:hypothetical protein
LMDSIGRARPPQLAASFISDQVSDFAYWHIALSNAAQRHVRSRRRLEVGDARSNRCDPSETFKCGALDRALQLDDHKRPAGEHHGRRGFQNFKIPSMEQTHKAIRCPQRGSLMSLKLAPGGKAARSLRCEQCEALDPLKADGVAGWLTQANFGRRNSPTRQTRRNVSSVRAFLPCTLLKPSDAAR